MFKIQNLWRNLKAQTKRVIAAERKERFTTGGGPISNEAGKVGSTCEAVRSLLGSQEPLTKVNDDDHMDSGTGMFKFLHGFSMTLDYMKYMYRNR